ncbi:MAG: hypothetical protein N3F07_02035 [Candidatus Micrarchaeota archaeon]|nr:hypothetical protein [Candidatus Micrarchaeota archaeon]
MGQEKIYLVYDFEELCGAFSSLKKAKEAVAEHISYIKKYTSEKAKRLGLGEAVFEVFEDCGQRRWVYALLAKSKNNGGDLHRRKIVICEYKKDTYCSSIKRLVEQQNAENQ